LLIAFYVLLAIAALASFNGGSKWVQRIAWSCWSICLVVVVIVPWFPRRLGQPEAEVIAVGHGLSVLVRSSDGHALLYDAGRMAEPHVGRRLIAPLLWQRGVSRLDTVILSHADSDHYNGLDDLLERFAIGEVLTPPGFATEKNPGAVRLIEHVKDRKITLRTIVAGDRWKHGDDLDIRVLHPSRSADEETSDNARSVVLDLQSNGHRLLLTGDLEGPGLAELTGNPPFPIDVFLAPHHGGRASNPIWVYEWAKPQMVVSSQRKPTVGSRDALDLIAEQGFRVWRTWNHGAIRLRWTTGGIDATNFLNVDHSSQ
jgi:competence protein ComEC